MVSAAAAAATFNTSHEWFHGFRVNGKLHNIKVPCKAASADTVAATRDPKDWQKSTKMKLPTIADFQCKQN